MKYIFLGNDRKDAYIVTAENKHLAIEKFVEKKHNGDMSGFYYGLDDGQIAIYEVKEMI